MNKKTIITLLLALLVLAAIVYFFTKNKGETKNNANAENNKATTNVKAEKKEEVKKNEIKKLAIGEYGDLKDFIKKDLSDVDKKALQGILNERNIEKARLLALIEKAKITPNADAGLINTALDNYNKSMAKFDARLEAYMTKEKFALYIKTVVKKEKEEIKQRVYIK